MKSTSHDALKRKSDRLDSWSITAETELERRHEDDGDPDFRGPARCAIARAQSRCERGGQTDDQETHYEPQARGSSARLGRSDAAEITGG
jgi:hypothetical protein